jgi:adenylylsulfate kinase-like enzyme
MRYRLLNKELDNTLNNITDKDCKKYFFNKNNMKKIYWFTGQAGAGKTELANALKLHLVREQSLISTNCPIHKFVIIDGDDIRALYKNTDYSIDGRKKNVDFVQKLCTFLIKNEIIPIVCMVSPFAEQRRIFVEENNGIEIYVHCNELRGRENYHVDYYEKPINHNNLIEIDTTLKSVQESFYNLFSILMKI